jgi:nitrile hydratase
MTPDGELAYHARWELRPLAIACLVGSDWRPSIEGLDPATYLASSYYDRWLRAAEHQLTTRGPIDADDLARWYAALADDAGVERPSYSDPQTVSAIREGFGPHIHGDVVDPAFEVGDRVRVRRMRPEAHHRCPRYVRGAVGEVERVCGSDPVPAIDDEREPVYTVRFASVDLFGDRTDQGEPPYVLLIDLWERYLEQP